MEREKITKSGRLLEVDFFPVWSDGRRMPSHPPVRKLSSEAQQKYNHQQAIKRAVRIVNANFSSGDIFMHPTYFQDMAPQTEAEATRDINNYFRRVKTKRAAELKQTEILLAERPNDKKLLKKREKLLQPFKYYYSLEQVTYKTGIRKGKINWHFHIFMTGGIERDTLEDMWPKGMRANADRFQPERFGAEAAARYISKDTQGRRRLRGSKNLEKPKTKTKDGRITARGVERLAKQRIDDRAYWENRYKGYYFVRCFSRFNNYNGHWYVSVVMYKPEKDGDLPGWEGEDWIT